MKPVLVTTKYRGVFFGYMDDGADKDSPAQLTLKNARNCTFWTAETRGFLGLSASGPGQGCRIGPKAESITLYGITSITPVSKEAVEKWEAAPWS